MQLAGAIMVFLGIFTKFAAVLSIIPDPMIGAMLAMALALIAGVSLSNLQVRRKDKFPHFFPPLTKFRFYFYSR